MEKTDIREIEIKKIVADPDQPRKHFGADEMFSLRKSIEKKGIKVPLTVMEVPNGKFLIIDGERRYRTAIDLGYKTLKVIVEPAMNESDKLLTQFHIQEQHAEWTALEKAVTLNKLSKQLGASIYEVCDMLGMKRRDKELYAAFSELADKENYVKNEVPLLFAAPFRSLKGTTRRICVEKLETEFNKSDEKKLENALIRNIKSGAIKENRDVVRLKDAFTKNPKLIGKFLADPHATPDSLFIEAKAKGAYYLRNLVTASSHVTNLARRFLETKDVQVEEDQLKHLKWCYKELGDILNLVE